MQCGYSALVSVCNSCLQLQLLDEDSQIGAYEESQNLDQVWIAWRFRETRRRTGLFIWVCQNHHKLFPLPVWAC
jgi:hypothetical protein